MTLAQIEKTREFLAKVDSVHGFVDMNRFVGEIKAFYDILFDLELDIYYHNTMVSYNEEYNENDRIAIKAFLEKQLAGCDDNVKVFEILNLIEEGKSTLGDNKKMDEFVSKAYYAYNGIIKFDKMTEAVATAPAEFLSLNYVQADENMVNGILNKLKEHATNIISAGSKKTNSTPSVVINNNNSASANSTVNIDISISIEQARQQVEDAGLADDQHQTVMDKLNEIEEIAKSKENKGKRWTKAKEILKWVAEQGITVAGIILPLLAPMIG